MISRQHTYIGLVISLIFAAILFFPNLGSFGMWEPHETDRFDIVEAIAGDTKLPPGTMYNTHPSEHLSALAWSIGGKSELMAKLPLAILAIITVVGLFFLVRPLGGPRIAFFASIFLASSPVLLFHGRQLTSHMPLLLGETFAVGGLALAAYGREFRTVMAGAVVALVGLVLGCISSGLLIGVAAPTATIAIAIALSGDAAAIFGMSDRDLSRGRQLVFFIAGLLAVLSAGAFFIFVQFLDGDIPLLTGGLASSTTKSKSFEFPLEQLAYGWFPWSALAPIPIINFFRAKSASDNQNQRLCAIVIAGIAVGYLAQSYYIAVCGVGPFFLIVPMALAAALAIVELESPSGPGRLGSMIALVLFVIMVRDFAQRPEAILMGYGFEKIKLPKDFAPIIQAAIFSAPTGLLILILGFIGAGVKRESRWWSLQSLILVPLVAACFGVYVTYSLVPGLSIHLSSKYAMESYKRFRHGNEPLGAFGTGRFLADAEELGSRDNVVDWLKRSDRAFVLFPHKDLAEFNRRFRKETGRHISVLDAKSDRFVLATSQFKPDEKDDNPITKFVKSEPFGPPPSNPLEVNFENKVTLLGWDVISQNGKAYMVHGKKVTFTTYWRCDDELSANYKVFMHIDGKGGRIHGDHKPVKGIYPTRMWNKGDYIKDVYSREIPMYQKKGKYSIRMGLFKGSKRLKILDPDNVRENSLWIAEVDLR
ncbi:MAG: hypothetical protein GY847_11530 [Proteobacteria bacterium]|nr:hypothetical protein [Pseudomonadota bacterium]